MFVYDNDSRDIKKALETTMARIVQIKRELIRFGPNGRQSDYLNLVNFMLFLLPALPPFPPLPTYPMIVGLLGGIIDRSQTTARSCRNTRTTVRSI
jgi:hypothetical protein